ncbi:hypothetical protein BZA05DRAFT_474859 [Tricharina praecox]|uniref:uncharacterized protein n=1 Tax=Tricharina praecox TaxID=43433 RepID=UPI00221F2D79|nr:uncharacterized protein BZA05DRAFT_474859 [Tricharina praecox]KAI5849857.1 hypothetical protein BZA05DRAFT_474859 [Tricharina praecox]
MVGKMSLNPAQALATVTVMNQHGEVIHNGSKSFFSAFKEAKDAYKQRKAEIAVERRSQGRARETVMRRNTTRTAGSIQEAPATPMVEDNSAHHSKKKHRKPTRRNSSSLSNRSGEEEITEDALVVRSAGAGDAFARQDSIQQQQQQQQQRQLQQQYEEEQEHQLYQQSHGGALSAHDHARDMAPALFNDPSVVAVQTLLARVQSIIDEINCITIGLTTLLTELQKTPETFAAVGLSLAEIANMLTHIAPGAMVVLKAGFPTVFALLSSPHFAVIAGVAGAATVIVLGGYKIVKSIMAGADVNMAMAYGELPDEAILEEAVLGGEILGEVVDDDRRIEAAPARVYYERVEELPPVAVPRSPEQEQKQEQKQIMPAEDPVTANLKEESRWLKRSNSTFKKSEEKKERVKVERRHTSAVTSSSSKKEKEEKKEKEKDKRHNKDEKEERRSKDKERERGKLERRATSTRQSSSSSSGVSSNRSESSERPSLRSAKTSPAVVTEKDGKDGKEKKEKKKNPLMKLFDGKSSK